MIALCYCYDFVYPAVVIENYDIPSSSTIEFELLYISYALSLYYFIIESQFNL